MSFSVTKSMTKTTLPVKGKDVVTITLTMESELAARPRDILIAWDFSAATASRFIPATGMPPSGRFCRIWWA